MSQAQFMFSLLPQAAQALPTTSDGHNNIKAADDHDAMHAVYGHADIIMLAVLCMVMMLAMLLCDHNIINAM